MSEDAGAASPPSWARATIADTGHYLNGLAFRPSDWEEVGLPIIRIQNLTDPRRPFNRTRREVPREYHVRSGDILVSWSATLDAFVWHGPDALLNQHIFKVTPNLRLVTARFLYHRLRYEIRRMVESEHLHGSTMTHINRGPFLRWSIWLPPVAEQDRIAAEIEKHFSQLGAGINALERVKVQLASHRASVLKAACEGRLVPTEAELARADGRRYETGRELLDRILRTRLETPRKSETSSKGLRRPVEPDASTASEPPEGWCWASIDMAGDLLLGRQRAPQYLKGLHPRSYLRVANIKDDHIDFSDLETMDFDGAHFEKYKLRPGDILLSEGQSQELLGQSAIYRGEVRDLCFQKTLHRFRPIPEGPSSEYSQIVFRSHVKSGMFRRYGSITTNIAHLTLEKLRTVPFPLPPSAEQTRIVTEVDRLLSIADESAATIDTVLARAERLRHAILKRAFEGKLVPQDPNDEPASVLLERIRKEREASAEDRRLEKKPRRVGGARKRRAARS